MIKVLCFGTFDSLHDGHRAMLREAKTLGSYLLVAVAPDSVVQKLKGALPHHKSASRIAMLRDERIADEVVLGDAEPNSWKIIKRYKPAIVALGYDQEELKQSLEQHLDNAFPEGEADDEGNFPNPSKKPKIVVLAPYEPDKFHNKILHSGPSL